MSYIHAHHPGITNLSGMGRAAQGGPRERESLHRTRSLAWNGLFYLWFWGWGAKLELWEAEDGTRWGPSPKIGLRFALGGLVMCAPWGSDRGLLRLENRLGPHGQISPKAAYL